LAFFFSSPDLKVALHPESKRNATRVFAYLSGQKHICIYSILILYVGYTCNTRDSSRLTHVIFAYLKCVFPRSSSPHQLKQRYANVFSSPEYKLLLAVRSHIPNSQTASCVFWGTKGIYLHTSRALFLQRWAPAIFPPYIETLSSLLKFLASKHS